MAFIAEKRSELVFINYQNQKKTSVEKDVYIAERQMTTLKTL